MTTTEIRLYSFEEIRNFAESVNMTVCHVYYYGFEDEETGEDPHGVLHTVDSLIEFLRNDVDYNYYEIGHMLVIYDDHGNSHIVITA